MVGTALNNWETGNMVVHPFRLGEAIIEQSKKQHSFRILKGKHLLETALDWKAKIELNPSLKTTYIYGHVGVSDGRVRQILRLAKLHENIQTEILSLPPPESEKAFPGETSPAVDSTFSRKPIGSIRGKIVQILL